MIIGGKHYSWQDIMVPVKHTAPAKRQLRNKSEKENFVWVAYDSSRARLPVAIAPSAKELARIMGVSRVTVESDWSHFRHGDRPSAKYAKVYIGEEE